MHSGKLKPLLMNALVNKRQIGLMKVNYQYFFFKNSDKEKEFFVKNYRKSFDKFSKLIKLELTKGKKLIINLVAMQPAKGISPKQ